MSRGSPTVSVLIPSFNHARFLPEALESVLEQTYRDFEIILADDGSTDRSLAVAEGYARRYPSQLRVLTHPNHQNRGISATINLCLREMRGEFFAAIPSDDVWYADKLEQQLAYLAERPELGVVYGYAEVIDEAGRKLPERRDDIDISVEPDPVARLIQGNVISGGTCLARRACLDQVGLFDEALVYSDWEFWIRVLSHWKIGYINRPLAKYRHHSYNTSVGATLRVQLERAAEVLSSLRRKAVSTGGTLAAARTRALLDLQLTFLRFCTGELDEAARHLASAFTVDSALVADVAYVERWFEARTKEGIWIQAVADPQVERDFETWMRRELPRAAGEVFAGSFGVIRELRAELGAARREVASMQTSRFWRLRARALKLKKLAGL